MLHLVEAEIAEYIDKLLVTANIESPRRIIKSFPGKDYSGDYIIHKSPTRVSIYIDFKTNCITVKYNQSECIFSLIFGNILSKKTTESFRKIAPYISQAIKKFQNKIDEQRKIYEQYKDWKIVRADNTVKDDDFLLNDFFINEKTKPHTR